MFEKVIRNLKQFSIYPRPFWNLLYINFFRKNTHSDKFLGVNTTRFSVFDLHSSAKLILHHHSTFGFKKYRRSRLETSLWMDKDSSIELGNKRRGVSIYHGCDIQIFKGASVKIGSCIINRGTQIICQDEITIGNDCLISRDVIIRDNDGGHKILTEGYKKTAPVHIGNHVWIGHGAMIMKGVTIGDGAIIGAGAWVVSNVKPKAVVMGDPARTIQKDVEWEA